MAKLLCTIWALIINSLGASIFQTCFASAMEDEDGESLITGPPITTFLFAAGVYTIIARATLFPQSFRKPNAALLCLYEFLMTSFFLEFSVACIWTPIDVLLLTTVPKTICHTLQRFGFTDAAEVFFNNKASLTVITQGIALSFFLLALHVTRSVDFSILTDCGVSDFGRYLKSRLWQQIESELPKTKKDRRCRCKMRNKRERRDRNDRSKSRVND